MASSGSNIEIAQPRKYGLRFVPMGHGVEFDGASQASGFRNAIPNWPSVTRKTTKAGRL